jgi:enterochelin esterase-like enzyme
MRTPNALPIALLLVVATCGPASTRLGYHALESAALLKPMEYAILAPPAVDGAAEAHVFYMLHGLGDDHRSLDRFGVSDRLWEGMRTGHLPQGWVVAPNGEQGFWIDWHDGTHDYESHFLEEVLPAAEAQIGIEGDRAHRHLVGVSMGGLGAVQIGLRHPELFASMSSLSGFFPDVHEAEQLVRGEPMFRNVDLKRVFGDCSDREFVDAHNPYQVVRRRGADLGQRLFLAVGALEPEDFTRTNRAFHELLEEKGVPHEYLVFDGRHRWRDWAPIIEQAMKYAVE